MTDETTATPQLPQPIEDLYAEIDSFDDLDLPESLLRGIYAKGFEKPSPIQRKAIVPIIHKRDVIAQAQSGTGKTATFSIAALQRVELDINRCQVVILSPTRELTAQTYEVIKDLGYLMPGLIVKILVGGNSIMEDINEMSTLQPHIVIGCPGRTLDMIKRRALNTSKINMIIVDEADYMLERGFQDQICDIFSYLDEDIQIVLFSATLPTYTLSLSNKFMINPYKILVSAENLSLDGIRQYFIAVNNDEEKMDKLKRVYEKKDVKQSMIYANSVERVIQLTRLLRDSGFCVCDIHSQMDKRHREEILAAFKAGTYRILVSTDLTSRGIDVQQMSLVINFDIPRCKQTYLHRIGRSGRWGRIGQAINMVSPRDITYMRDIEIFYKKQIDEFELL